MAAVDRAATARPPYRLYEVQNGNHIETYQDTFPQLELIQPHAQRAFELLVRHVEQRTPLPPDQCIGRGGLDRRRAVGSRAPARTCWCLERALIRSSRSPATAPRPPGRGTPRTRAPGSRRTGAGPAAGRWRGSRCACPGRCGRVPRVSIRPLAATAPAPAAGGGGSTGRHRVPGARAVRAPQLRAGQVDEVHALGHHQQMLLRPAAVAQRVQVIGHIGAAPK